ncbi:MAG: hypothetical protein AAF429_12210 [Pseudomonadota bacterium]
MNPIKDFDRLESLGLWRAADARQRVEVVVSFGKETLVLSDINNNPLTHWSLATIQHLGTSEDGSIFSADAEGTETLEIEDPTMIAAISKVRNIISAARPHPGRLRFLLRVAAILFFVGLILFWLPVQIKSYAARVVPPAKASDISEEVLAAMERITGPACHSQAGRQSLNRLKVRVLPGNTISLHVLQLGQKPSTRLPNGDIVLNEAMLLDADTPDIAAGYVIAQNTVEQTHPITRKLFDDLTVFQTVKFLANGQINASEIESLAKELIFAEAQFSDDQTLQLAFFEAQVPHQAFAQHAKLSALASKNNSQLGDTSPLLDDAAWIALTEICNG